MFRPARPLITALFGAAIVLVSSTAIVTGQQSAPADATAARAAIEAANAGFLDAFKRADTAAMVRNYAPDAIMMMPNQPMARGRDEIQQNLNAFVSEVSFKGGSVVTTDVMVSGDLAVETGTFQWTLQPKTGAEIKDTGKYLTVWKRQADGSWKIVRDINNSDLPPKM